MGISYCQEFSLKFDIPLKCCDSCHDDFDSGYSDLCEIELQNVTYQVCCRMFNNYKENYSCHES